MNLDFSSLQKAVFALERALVVLNDKPFVRSSPETETIRAGVIQSFEFTYELCWKFIKRWLEVNVDPTIVAGATRRELFRYAAEYRLIDDVDKWMDYHDARNRTSHTYDPLTAEEILEHIEPFYRDAVKLLQVLEMKND